jgi:hypothetical protein
MLAIFDGWTIEDAIVLLILVVVLIVVVNWLLSLAKR